MNRISTGIEALDNILQGGLPAGSSILISGTPGTGKTILASQIVFKNASPENKVLYLTTMSEPQAKVIKFQNEFQYFDIDKFQSSVIYYDLSAIIRNEGTSKILTLVDDLLYKYQPKIVVIDTIKVLNDIISSTIDIREFILNLSLKLAVWDCTTLFLGEYAEDEISSRPESAIVDGIMHLSGTEEKKYQKRYLRILKMRGTNYTQGQVFFKISSGGIVLYPRLNPEMSDQTYIRDYSNRISTGVPDIDLMMSGGIPRSTITLISGGSGTGKTVLAVNFAFNGLKNGESVVYVTFEENPDQLINSALSIGMDIRPYLSNRRLKLIHMSPVELDMDEHLFMLQDSISTIKATRIVIDSISSFELGIQDKVKYTDFIFSLTNYFKTLGITAYLTHEIHNSINVSEFTKHGTSFVADNLILLETKEDGLDIKRFIRIVKVRASRHEMRLKEFVIDDKNIEIIK